MMVGPGGERRKGKGRGGVLGFDGLEFKFSTFRVSLPVGGCAVEHCATEGTPPAQLSREPVMAGQLSPHHRHPGPTNLTSMIGRYFRGFDALIG